MGPSSLPSSGGRSMLCLGSGVYYHFASIRLYIEVGYPFTRTSFGRSSNMNCNLAFGVSQCDCNMHPFYNLSSTRMQRGRRW
ncbi:hypothetical protein P171DRAFT_92229 [Karstenula rhodostoma CBS 690.94]|uniref:Uncharacterized protein n=1 Tax=Karstenula rhodostoma CBS 690.94 TaxID=1392251 RepID=A0A9P4U9M6_9PLEO|nr:hypothetical protein P171DRAFT_92229 [Karstenula rhodostoma CBS 690.94]